MNMTLRLLIFGFGFASFFGGVVWLITRSPRNKGDLHGGGIGKSGDAA